MDAIKQLYFEYVQAQRKVLKARAELDAATYQAMIDNNVPPSLGLNWDTMSWEERKD